MRIPWSKNVVLFMMVAHLFVFIAVGTSILIYITLGHPLVDGCTPNYCSITASSFDYSMNTKSTDVAFGISCWLTHQLLLHLHKNSITNVLVLYISWIIICTNCIFSLYILPFSHFEDDGECSNDLTTND
jgi:hypothetical protein